MTISERTPSLATCVDAEPGSDYEGFDLEHLPLRNQNAFAAGQIGREKEASGNIISRGDMDAELLSCVMDLLF